MRTRRRRLAGLTPQTEATPCGYAHTCADSKRSPPAEAPAPVAPKGDEGSAKEKEEKEEKDRPSNPRASGPDTPKLRPSNRTCQEAAEGDSLTFL
jgi:hypothetical protein